MEREHRKKIYIRKIRAEPIYEIYEAALTNVYSKNVVEEIVESLCRCENKRDLGRVLDLIMRKRSEDISFRRKSYTLKYVDILTRISITVATFDSVYRFFQDVTLKKLDTENLGMVSKNFLNFFIYKNCTGDFQDFVPFDVDLSNPLYHKLFLEHYLQVILKNKTSEVASFIKLRDFPDKNIFLHILGENTVVEFNTVKEKHMDHVDPLLVQNIRHERYMTRFLCFLNAEEDTCRVCFRNIKKLRRYFEIQKHHFDEMLDSLVCRNLDFTDMSILTHYLRHESLFCNSKNLKDILSVAMQRSEPGRAVLSLLALFPMKEDSECILVDAMKIIHKSEKMYLKFLALEIAEYAQMTDKIAFGVFIIALNLFRAHQENSFINLSLRNFVFRHKVKFNRITHIILEHFFDELKERKLSKEAFELEVETLACILGCNVSDFFDTNMLFIFPIVISKNLLGLFNFSDRDILYNLPYFIISQILAGKRLEEDLFGYCVTDVISEFGSKIISYLLVLDYTKILDLEQYIGNVPAFFEKNLTPILFNVRKIYMERESLLLCTTEDILKFITQLLLPNLMHNFTYIFPFIEFFMHRNERQLGFVDWFYDQLDSKTASRYSHMIFPYLSIEKLCNIKGMSTVLDIGKCIRIGSVLLDSRGLYGQEIAIEKIGRILQALFTQDLLDSSREVGMETSENRLNVQNGTKLVAFGAVVEKDCKNGCSGFSAESRKSGTGDSLFVRNFIAEFKQNPELKVFVQRFLDHAVGQKTSSADLVETICLIGSVEIQQRRLYNACYVLQEVTTMEIAKVLLDSYLFKIDAYNQDVHFFVIQETLRYIPQIDILDSYTQELVSQFRNSRYFLPLNFEYKDTEIYEKGLKYAIFVERLLNYVLHLLQKYRLTDFFQLLQYGLLLRTDAKEFYVLCGIHVLLKHNLVREIKDKAEEITKCIDSGTDQKISEFFLRAQTFTKNELLTNTCALGVSLSIGKHYYSIFLLEKIIRKRRNQKEFWDSMLHNSYAIGDTDTILGINTIFNRLDSVNLFYGFCVERNFHLAQCCLDPVDKNFESMKKVLTKSAEDSDDDLVIRKFFETCKKLRYRLQTWECNDRNEYACKSGELHNRSTYNILNNTYCQNMQEMSKHVKTSGAFGFSSGAEDESRAFARRYKAFIMSSDSMKAETKLESLHFIKDLELIKECCGFDLVLERLKIAKNIEFSRYENLVNTLKEMRYCSGVFDFERKLKLLKIKRLRIKGETEQAITEITKMLIKKEWWALYEQSKVLVSMNRRVDAKTSLKRLLTLLPEDDPLYTKGLVFQARVSNSKVFFDETLKRVGNSEKLFYYQGKYFEKHDALKAMESYKNSIQYGRRFNNETIPLIFHLFCEEGSAKKKVSFYRDGRKIIEDIISKMPSRETFLPFFNQIIPKISHSKHEVVDVISRILQILFNDFPLLTFWNSLIFVNSTHQETARRLEKVIGEISFDSKVILRSFKQVSAIFVEISQYTAKTSCLSFSKHFRKFLELLPTRVSMPDSLYSTTIEAVGDEIQVFSSLQSPKRIELIGKNGISYMFLCKPNDDLRKDNRFMDLALLLNNIFVNEPECKEYMEIRRYNVIPITHKNGLIEWISGLKSFKSICESYYRENNLSISETVQKFRMKKKIGTEKYRDIVKTYPPVFYRWFEDEFLDPRAWFRARRRYIQTYAVMNGVGWFMGLGDRHGENIMFDVVTGDTVHVDLNCLFERGKNFELPEKVPFRLTQNIVDAFGVLLTEGPYRKTLETTLKVIFERRDLIIANLLSFLYDPLFEWNKRLSGEQIIQGLKNKLETSDVQDKADELIQDATSESNLGNMYIGWLSFI